MGDDFDPQDLSAEEEESDVDEVDSEPMG